MKTYIQAALALGLLGSTQAFGQAVLSQTCPVSSKIKLPANSQGFYMSGDCKTAYILPPEQGQISVEGISESSSLGRCQELGQLLKELKKLTHTITKADMSFAIPATNEPEDDPFDSLPGEFDEYGLETPEKKLTEEEVIKLLTERRSLSEKIVQSFGKTPAVLVNLSYKTGYGELLQKVRDLNSGLNLNFQTLPLKNTHFSFTTPNFKDTDYPMAISAGFPLDQDELLSGSTSGSVELSLLGACPLVSPFSGRLPRSISARKISPYLTASLSYEYELLSTLNYSAKFHRGGMAKKIREVSTSGGFFSTKTSSKLTTSARSESWFKYDFTCDDSRACEDAHKENIVDIKKRLMDEVLANITFVKIGYDLAPEAAGVPGRTGATAASEAVKKCSHKYCQIAGAVLDVAQAAFGKTNKFDSYTNSETHWASETATTRKPYPYQGSMGFSPRD